MQLIVFCRSGFAYNVPDKIIEQAAIHDLNYENGTYKQMQDAVEFFESIEKKYKKIIIGHLLSGDIG